MLVVMGFAIQKLGKQLDAADNTTFQPKSAICIWKLSGIQWNIAFMKKDC